MKNFRIAPLLFLCACFSNQIVSSQNINLSEETDFNGEPFLAMNPNNPQHLVVAWMGLNGLQLIQIHVRVSFNGGANWSSIHTFSHLPGHNTSADPSIDFDSGGNVYVCLIDYDIAGSTGGVYVYKSGDGGITFSDAVKAIHADDDAGEYPVDRPWMVIDKSGGETNGNIYITTKPAPWEPIPNSNYLVISTDGGTTYSDWKHLDAPGWSIGNFIAAPMASPAVSPDGKLYCIYPSFEITESFLPRFICAKSDDAGETFFYSLVKSGINLNADTILKFGYLLITDDADAEHLAFLNILSPFDDPDILLNESFDGGETWGAEERVNDDATANHVSQDLVWADYDTSGNLLVTWRDRRNAPDTGSLTSYEIFAAVKWKDSISFSHNFRIADTIIAFDDVLTENGNDFMSCKFAGDTVYAVWGDTRDGNLNIWFSKTDAKTAVSSSVINLTEHKENFLYPNPAVISEPVFISSSEKEKMHIRLYNAEGKFLQQEIVSANQPFYANTITEDGTYFYTIKDGKSGQIIFKKK